jgi:RluA family pseudouridine synthase
MSLRTWRHVVSRHEHGCRLDAICGAHLPAALGRDLSRAEIRRLVMAGAVRVDGLQHRRPGSAIREGASIEARVDLARVATRAGQSRVRLSERDILLEDDDLIAVAKPAGVSTHATADPRRPDLVSLVREWLASGGAPGAPYVGVHQRLDRDTSGVVLFTKTERANGPLARAFAAHAIVKSYHALTIVPRRRVPDAWSIDLPLAMSGRGATSCMVPTTGGLGARTDVRILERRRHAWLVEARPVTGRRHQVRAHLAHEGLPVLGDVRYGAPASGRSSAERVMLHCARLELRHPVTAAALAIECAWPRDFAARLEGAGRVDP